MKELTFEMPVEHVSLKAIVQSFAPMFLVALSKIPGSVAETFLFTSLWAVFAGWQVCNLIISGAWGSPVEMFLVGIQLAIIAVLFTKLILWFRIQKI